MTVYKTYIFQWSKVFPADQVTEQKSVLFVKKLLAVAISNITYLRTIFPDNAYADRCIEGFDMIITSVEHLKKITCITPHPKLLLSNAAPVCLFATVNT